MHPAVRQRVRGHLLDVVVVAGARQLPAAALAACADHLLQLARTHLMIHIALFQCKGPTLSAFQPPAQNPSQGADRAPLPMTGTPHSCN